MAAKVLPDFEEAVKDTRKALEKEAVKDTRKALEKEAGDTPEKLVGAEIISDEMAAEIFRAIGDESRMKILALLGGKELCAGDLLKSLSIVQSTLSHHMKVLTESGVVRCRKQGKWSYYSIDKEMLTEVGRYLMKWS